MVINSAHLLAQTAAVTERLVPLFWALDNFKNSQAADVKEGDWALGKVDESHVPAPIVLGTNTSRPWKPGTQRRPMRPWPGFAAARGGRDHGAGLANGRARPEEYRP